VFVSPRRDVRAARRFFEQAIGTTKSRPIEGGHRSSTDLPTRAGRAAAGGVASHRSVRQQPGGGWPWALKSVFPTFG
jgi:hypothetical protein